MKSIRKTIHCIVSGQMQSHTILRSVVEARRRFKRVNLSSEDTQDQKNDFFGEKIKCVHYGIINDNSAKSHFFSPSNLVMSEGECVLDHYLEEQEKRQATSPGEEATDRLSDKQLLFLLCDLFGAGLDTSLVSLLWFLLFIAINKKEQVRSQNY